MEPDYVVFINGECYAISTSKEEALQYIKDAQEGEKVKVEVYECTYTRIL